MLVDVLYVYIIWDLGCCLLFYVCLHTYKLCSFRCSYTDGLLLVLLLGLLVYAHVYACSVFCVVVCILCCLFSFVVFVRIYSMIEMLIVVFVSEFIRYVWYVLLFGVCCFLFVYIYYGLLCCLMFNTCI